MENIKGFICSRCNHEKSYFPGVKIVKWSDDFVTQLKLERNFNIYVKEDYIYNNDWHPGISIVHYAGS